MKRRDFLSNLALGVGATAAAGAFTSFAYGGPPTQTWRTQHAGKMQPLGTARNLIFVLLEGGPSHVDTFDLKTNRETPNSLGAQNLGGTLWPAGIMPNLVKHQSKFSLVRSLVANEAVHERGVYHLTTGYRHDPSRVSEIPHFASVMSYKLHGSRAAGDSLPSVVMFGDTAAGNGFFSIDHRGLQLNEDGNIPYIQREITPFEGSNSRYNLLDKMVNRLNVSDARQDRIRQIQQGRQMMTDPTLLGFIQPNEDEAGTGEYEDNLFINQCKSVVNLLDANKGTRVVQMFHGGWDHHDRIYSQENLPTLAASLDQGLAYLIENLENKPAKSGSGTLLDETLVVAAGEFGRTINGLNESAGRDHYPYAMSAFFAGGGVKGGRVIGATDSLGSYVSDRGWSHNRDMGINDLNATMYSALGIDWTERFTNTPSGRLYEILPSALGVPQAIDPLFI